MADSAIETKETTPVVEKESVTSSVKESPKKETNGAKVEDKAENGSGDKLGDAATPKENGSSDNGDKEDDVEEVKENGDSNGAGDACAIKRKSDVCEAPTPEKKAKVVEDDSPAVAEESNDAEAIEA